MKNITTRTTSNTSNIYTPNCVLRVLHALDLKRGEVTDEQLQELDAVLTDFAVESVETAGGSIR